jgi:Protein of unknown function (DUF3048) N-terminal domain/Protein of unknown function (DUF3048) C-terminal domain
MRRREALRVSAAVLGVGLFAACGGGTKSPEVAESIAPPETTGTTSAPVSVVEATTTTATPTTTTTPPETTTTIPIPEERFPLTGLPVYEPAYAARPALAVKMDNHWDARPHAGINQADIVYEEIVEGITRFFVIFHSQDVGPIGPVRSARTTDVDLLNQLNRPLFAWSGGNRGVVSAIGNANAESRAHGQLPEFYYRDQDRRSRADLEHTLLAHDTSQFYTTVYPNQGPPPVFFNWRAPDAKVAGDAASLLALDINSVDVGWVWDETSALWIRSEYGNPHVDTTGAPVSANNVMIQFCDYRRSQADPKSPEAVTVGYGEAILLSGGKVVRGTWERGEAGAPAIFKDAGGEPMELTPGRTWIELAEAGVTNATIG